MREWAHDYDRQYKKTYGKNCPDPIRYLLEYLLEESKKSMRARNRANIVIKASGGLLDESGEAKALKYEIVSDPKETVPAETVIEESEPAAVDLVSMDVNTITIEQLKNVDYKLLTNKQRSALLKRFGNDTFYELFGSQMA